MVDNIGIVDTRNIISAITDTYGIDMSDYTFTIFKRRLIHTINVFGCHSSDDFIDKMKKGDISADDFLYEMSLEATELFRDPSFWRELRDKYLPEICKTPDCKIWMPAVTSGDELFTLNIVLCEANLQNKASIIANCPSQRHVDLIKSGVGYDPKKSR